MKLDDFIITCFCTIDEMLPAATKSKRLRQRGPMPTQADSEVITMEVVGTYLGLSQDQEVFDYFRRHYRHFFPAMGRVARTTFVRQAANLWAVKERLWCWLRDDLISYDASLSIVDSVPLPVCWFARALWCVRFRGQASYGKDHADRQTFYGFRVHTHLSWPGLITRVFLAPANEADGEIVPLLLEKVTGVVLGDRNYWLPNLQAYLRSKGIVLQAPFRQSTRAPSSSLQQSGVGPSPVSHRYRLWATDGSLSHEARLGTRPVAFAQQAIALPVDAYGLLFLQSARSSSLSAI
jgi:hypothetical protein